MSVYISPNIGEKIRQIINDNRSANLAYIQEMCRDILPCITDGTKCNIDALYYPEMKEQIKIKNMLYYTNGWKKM